MSDSDSDDPMSGLARDDDEDMDKKAKTEPGSSSGKATAVGNTSGGGAGLLASFMLGNIDSDGRLENEDLFGTSVDARAKVSGLTHLLNIDETLMGAKKSEEETPDEDYESGKKDSDAKDFSNIDEAIDSDSSSSGSESDQENPPTNSAPKLQVRNHQIQYVYFVFIQRTKFSAKLPIIACCGASWTSRTCN